LRAEVLRDETCRFVAYYCCSVSGGSVYFQRSHFSFSYYESQSTRREAGRWKPEWPQANGGWLSAMLKEFPITAIDLIWLPFGFLNRDSANNRYRGNSKPPVIFVHGWSQNRITFAWIIGKLRNRLAGRQLYTLNMPTTSKTLPELADYLAKRMDEALRQTGQSKAAIVGHSLGGLVTREYAARYGSGKIEAVITLATPHAGSKLSFPALAPVGGPVMHEMEPGSETLKRLAKEKIEGVRFVCVGSVHDNFVLPFDSSFLPGAEEIVIDGVGHNGLLFDTRVLDIIENTLDNISVETEDEKISEQNKEPEKKSRSKKTRANKADSENVEKSSTNK